MPGFESSRSSCQTCLATFPSRAPRSSGRPFERCQRQSGLAAIPKDEFKSEIDMTRPLPRQDQFCSGAPDRIAIYTDGGETWCDQTAHFEIAEADDRDRLLGRRAVAQQARLSQTGHEADRMRIVCRKHRVDT